MFNSCYKDTCLKTAENKSAKLEITRQVRKHVPGKSKEIKNNDKSEKVAGFRERLQVSKTSVKITFKITVLLICYA